MFYDPNIVKLALWQHCFKEVLFPRSYPTGAIHVWKTTVSFPLDLGLFLHSHYGRFISRAPALTRMNAFRLLPYSNRFG
ncbi:hypothetical protein J2Z66_008343 [Paenibacillus eucommiae]|uniref:Uncharacterized protein n=1 Tax=Paenibacillus eucommiae TaxID=1355755 RepID=A0ABS4JA29_9BACL|nr:hypothetical protein [Paenibacillus eucommiae]